ncbi:MAG TPA: S8 family serine peptidase [Chloroflexi bacterium]|nr:S8 family serine peptidase [Chloroflexota bacterium]
MQVHRRILSALLALSLLASLTTPALAQTSWPSGRGGGAPGAATVQPQAPTSVSARPFTRISPEEAAAIANQLPARTWSAPRGTALPSGRTPAAAAAFAAQGDQVINVIAHLEMPALLQGVSASADGAVRAAYAEALAAEQARVSADIEALGGNVVFTFNTLSSGIAVQIPANQAASLASIRGVSHVSQVHDYSRDLEETVPMIGAQFLQEIGVKGAGVKVAVLDSGIDFTHLAFGGPGTVAAWEEAYYGNDPECDQNEWSDPDCAYARPANPAFFGPAAPRIKGGFDWLGEEWPNGQGRILPDPNPIDIEGHGTHVADIIGGLAYPAGVNVDGPYPAKGAGVAPEADIYGFKVCASFSTSCNGLALLKAMDNAADLDGNPTTVDPADVINMSLGSPYGQPEDDLTWFTNQAVSLGIIVVASAGNSANKPYIVGSPSMADGAISVAQTTVPSATRYPLFYASSAVSGTISNAVWQNWSVLPGNTLVQGAVAYGNADGSNKNGCAAYTDNMTGKVVLADRGGCNFTLKAKNASAAGAILSLIGLVAPGDPFEGGDGGDRPIDIPSFMINQATANILKAQIANGVVAGINPADAINLAFTMVGSSSRGPRNHDGVIKPDIGAPGASVSAIAAGGAASGPFGGTSGAAPMVSGVAALLKSVYGDSLLPQQYKALLMNTGDPIYNDVPRNDLAPVTRVGGGQVNARSAYYSKLIAWDSTDAESPLSWTGSMSFGYVPASSYQVYTRTLTIQNLGPLGQGIKLSSWFRSGDDAAQGIFVTPQVTTAFIPAGGSIEVPVVLEIYPGGDEAQGLGPLHPWSVNRGSLGADGSSLQFQEYDGYVLIESQSNDPIHVVWQVLPKAVADIAVNVTSPTAGALVNQSLSVEGASDIFGLMEVDGNDYNYVVGDCTSLGLPPGCNLSPVDIHEVGVRAYTDTVPYDFLEFAVTLWDEPYRAGQYPPEFDIYIDSNADGTDDYLIFNGDLTLNASDGRNVVFLVDLSVSPPVAQPQYFIDATFNSQNFILPMDAASIGVTPGQPFRFSVFAYDAYFANDLWDCAPKVSNVCTGAYQYTPGVARYDVPEAQLFPTVPGGGSAAFSWTTSAAAAEASPDQIGLLFMHRNAHVGRESDHIVFTETYLPIIKN